MSTAWLRIPEACAEKAWRAELVEPQKGSCCDDLALGIFGNRLGTGCAH